MINGKVLPWAVFALVMALAGTSLLPAKPVRGFEVDGFGRLPILEGGRIKPFDSLARNSLLMIRGQQSFSAGQTVTADEWLLDVLFRPDVANRQPVFVIDDPEVLGLFGFKQTSDRYFSLLTLTPHLDEIERLAGAARQLDSKQRTRFQGAVLNLYQRIGLYYRLQNTVQIARGPALAAEIAVPLDAVAAERHRRMDQFAAFRPLPRSGAELFRSTGEALRAGAPDRGLEALSRVSTAWASQDAGAFNRSVAELAAIDREAQPGAVRHAAGEALFNRAQPFYLGMILYVLAALVLFASWLWKPLPLQRASFAVLAAGAVVHTAGLAARMALQGRPPVTNLYSSAIFVGWCAVVVGIVLERIYRRGFGTAVAAACGFVSLIIAHHLTGDGDTMEMMRAVLDSNIWLATHVVTITIGYSGTFLAGMLAAGYALRRHFASRADPAITRSLVSMVYGVICFSLFFSFVGTVLGGIWADQSWGRFWGWDPKENGALLIVLWNAIILHARWGGYVRERGLMAMAVFGNVVTSLSWFGVNMLGIGLHSYGFMEKAFWPLSTFIASQLVLVTLCLLPPLRSHASATGNAA
jgi:ABC-type transport system involved in cytochrome c biogenesis permease subunit